MNTTEKLDLIVTEAWTIFNHQFLNGRIQVEKEAPFQHHLANIIRDLGNLYCFSRSETFIVDLETKELNIRKKNKFIDITFGFYDGPKLLAKAAMELKFKKKIQGAEDFARIDSYQDIESLEYCLERGYSNAYFCMIADDLIYSKASKIATTGDIFSMREGYVTPINIPISNANCKGRKDVIVTFKKAHTFEWQVQNGYLFLCMFLHKD